MAWKEHSCIWLGHRRHVERPAPYVTQSPQSGPAKAQTTSTVGSFAPHDRPAEPAFCFASISTEVVPLETYHDYLRAYSSELGSRIVEMHPPLQGPKDPIAPALKTLLRRPLPAQAMTITGAAKYLQTEDTVRLVGECGTGKTLMSIGIAHAHAEAKPYNAIAMCPPHLVLKWAREVLVTV